MPSNASMRPSWTIESISSADPILAPNRAVGIRYGARVMFSMPPATTTSTSPALIICAAIATALSPEPQSMLIEVAGTSLGIPAAIATWRAGFGPSPACSTHPRMTSSTSPPANPARSSAARTATAPSSVADTSLNCPPKLPTGVRTALTITASSITDSFDYTFQARRGLPRRSHVHPAVDAEGLTGDVRGLVRDQEVDRPRDLVGPTKPTHRDLLLDGVERFLGNVLQHLGRDESRRDRVDGDPDLADDRRDVDDPSRPALNHVRQHRLRHEERAREVDRDHLVPILVGHLQDRLVDRDPSVVDQDVEPPMRVNHFLDGAATVLGRTDITLMDARVNVMAAQQIQELVGAIGVAAVAGGGDRALLGEAAADRRADAARTAGYERDPSMQSRPAMVGREGLRSQRLVNSGHGAHRFSPRSCLSGPSASPAGRRGRGSRSPCACKPLPRAATASPRIMSWCSVSFGRKPDGSRTRRVNKGGGQHVG